MKLKNLRQWAEAALPGTSITYVEAVEVPSVAGPPTLVQAPIYQSAMRDAYTLFEEGLVALFQRPVYLARDGSAMRAFAYVAVRISPRARKALDRISEE